MHTIQFLAAVLAILLALPLPARAQESPEQQLTGGSSREWVFRRVVRSMGPSVACTSGLTYTFEQASRSLLVNECKSGRLEGTRYQWHLGKAGPGDMALVIDRLGTYLLLFRDGPDGARYMRLRKQGSSPTQATEDREFRMSED